MGWWAIFRREMILLKQRASRLGYVFASVFYPLIYLFAFGLGLGKVVQVEGGYGAFLCAGMAGISVMTNSFQQTSIAISVGRIYYKTFQSLMVSPVPPGQVAVGLMLAGMVRGMVAAMIQSAVLRSLMLVRTLAATTMPKRSPLPAPSRRRARRRHRRCRGRCRACR